MRKVYVSWALVALGIVSAMAQSGPAQSSTVRTSGFPVVETISVDATEAPRKVFHAKLTIPATPGDFVLLYPKWIPGEHGPTGPLADSAGIYFRAEGKTLNWHRDPVDMYAYHVEVPKGVASIEASIDYLSPVETPGGFSAGSSATDKTAVLSWNWFLLYPQGKGSDEVGVKATLRMPEGWQWATALPTGAANAPSTGTPVEFNLASLTTMVDSPVLMGQYIKKIPLQVGKSPAHELDIAADSPAALQMQPFQEKAFDNLVAEAGALYGAHHYRSYHFLLTMSDHIAHFGLEHHESNDSRLAEGYLTDPTKWAMGGMLLPHEYTHSWNGKYRRPAGLATPEYETPMQGNLLWVYEGLTEYFGYVLTGRSGLWTPEQWRDNMARVAMDFTYRPGRKWRPLEDTATAAQTLYGAGEGFSNYRRSVDYYDEGALIWLEVDSIIRQKSGGKRSMDDFAHLFHGGQDTPPMVRTYTFDDVVNTLNQVEPYDWRGFFTARVLKVAEQAPLGGIENSGWKVVYTSEQNAFSKMAQQEGGGFEGMASLGLLLDRQGRVADAIEGGIAAKNGIGPGMVVVAVNGRKYTPEFLEAALVEAQKSHQPIQLLIENTEYFHTVSLSYFDGPRHPHLVRDESKPDMLSDIIRAKVTTYPGTWQ